MKMIWNKNSNRFKMTAICIAMFMTVSLVWWDASVASKARAAGADVSDTTHVIMAGDTELAVVGSYNEGEMAVELIKDSYGANDSAEEAIVSPAITVKPVETAVAEKDPEVMNAKEAAESIIEKNSGDEPIFTVAVKRSGLSKISVPYKTKTVEDSDLEEGKTKVVTEGENGVSLIMGDTVLVNGQQTESNILETKVLKKPVDKVIHKGTKEKEVKKDATSSKSSSSSKATSSSQGSGTTTGSFTWPIPSSHNVVSGYGGRVGPIYGNEFHMGIDIAGSYGAPIVAADGGTVVEAGWHYSYGYQVVIQHSNGLKTKYAHNSSLAVSVGQKVSKGQTISYCGSTGDSVATHLHFEVWLGGSHVNPYNYL